MILFSRSISISHCRCVVSCFVTATIDMSERYTVPRGWSPTPRDRAKIYYQARGAQLCDRKVVESPRTGGSRCMR